MQAGGVVVRSSMGEFMQSQCRPCEAHSGAAGLAWAPPPQKIRAFELLANRLSQRSGAGVGRVAGDALAQGLNACCHDGRGGIKVWLACCKPDDLHKDLEAWISFLPRCWRAGISADGQRIDEGTTHINALLLHRCGKVCERHRLGGLD